MRPIVLALGLLALLAAVPAAEASCHFCLDNTVASCTALDTPSCTANATYMATHMASHLLETACYVIKLPC